MFVRLLALHVQRDVCVRVRRVPTFCARLDGHAARRSWICCVRVWCLAISRRRIFDRSKVITLKFKLSRPCGELAACFPASSPDISRANILWRFHLLPSSDDWPGKVGLLKRHSWRLTTSKTPPRATQQPERQRVIRELLGLPSDLFYVSVRVGTQCARAVSALQLFCCASCLAQEGGRRRR